MQIMARLDWPQKGPAMRYLILFIYQIYTLLRRLSADRMSASTAGRRHAKQSEQAGFATVPPPLPGEVFGTGDLDEPTADKEPWPTVWPFDAVPVMGRAEQGMYHQLRVTFPDYVILAQVALSRVVTVRMGYPAREWNNRINRMSLDFVVCRKDSSVVAAIELDDRSHLRSEAQVRDAKKDAVLRAAGIPLFRWQASRLPDRHALLEALAATSVRR